ncbi:hypothetical protein DITRI_Ditri03aG0081500 [Diplodiscus trichospermus]
MDQPSLRNNHVKLLGFNILSLTTSFNSSTFCLNGNPISRTEIVGVITSREQKPSKFLKFTLDDGTASITCILWLNQQTSRYFSKRQPTTVRVISDLAQRFAADVQIGKVARVRGRITCYRGEFQVTVSDVVIERDPNAETLHWLDCLYLARHCYGVEKEQDEEKEMEGGKEDVVCLQPPASPGWKKKVLPNVVEVMFSLNHKILESIPGQYGLWRIFRYYFGYIDRMRILAPLWDKIASEAI